MNINNCYTGTNIEQIEDECGNNFLSTSCVQTPNAISYLDLPAGSSQTEINAAITTSLLFKDQQIAEFSSTVIEAGDNIEVTGVGSEENPYVVSSPLQDLQSVIDTGAEAEVDGGNSSISLLAGSEENRYCHADVSNPTESAGWSIIPTRARIQSFVNSTSIARLDMENGEVKLKRIKSSVFPNLETKVTITLPIVTTEIRVPAKALSGIYNIVVEPNSPYLVSTLPAGQLGDIATVTDANAPTYLGTLTGGGTTVTPVWHNGTIWVAR